MSENLEYIPHSKPTLGEDEAQAVSEVIASGHIAQGERVEAFENALAEFIGVPYAVAVNSGTSALHLTLLAMGIGTGDEVIIPSYVCTALLNAVNYTGAQPVISDVLPDTYNIDPVDVLRKKTFRTKAIIVPHMFGLPSDMDSIKAIGLPIIEDCAQAIGATVAGQATGSIGEAAVFSFYATKMITTGEGGMVVSPSKQLVKRVRSLRDYDNHKDFFVRYNYKMTDIQAALGIIQLSRLQSFIEKRREIAVQYDTVFNSGSFRPPYKNAGHVYYRYVIESKYDDAAVFIKELHQEGVGCARPVYRPLHQYLGSEKCESSEKIWKKSISIPIYPMLLQSEIDRIIRLIADQFEITD